MTLSFVNQLGNRGTDNMALINKIIFYLLLFYPIPCAVLAPPALLNAEPVYPGLNISKKLSAADLTGVPYALLLSITAY